eukprot:gnl/TRDRNA2_/TRDRNA2_172288_c0_seq4.p1 gnl/TRDRNA2_/TRDRNA2_172288_c0~~gnl/TRDRNA2_/TRDRNA2_172288_c0_seq4.p1  ORF type:complete len:731 (+),score=62.05 gnl/TRDRNA2_/TRDRNA2_172288_c0_seq4:319-2193(+)
MLGLGAHFAAAMPQPTAVAGSPQSQGLSASPLSMSAHSGAPGGVYDPIAAAVGLAADTGVRNRSYTPMPVANAPMQGDILNRRSFTPLPVTAATVQPVGDILNRRSFTPVPSNATPMPVGMSVLQQPQPDLLSRSYTPMPASQAVTAADHFLNRSYVPMPVDAMPVATPVVDMLSKSLTQMKPPELPASSSGPAPIPASARHPLDASLSHNPRCPSFTQAPVPVNLNVYWQRPVTFDEHGRVVRQLGGGELTWGNKFLKDVLGVYHVGIEVHGVEYCFGNYHAPQAKQIGGPDSGVFLHEPQKPGPHCVFKQAVSLGMTPHSPGKVQDICAKFGDGQFKRSSYKRIAHNCTDFARLLASSLGVGDLPLWCYRGAATAKALGLGGEAADTSGVGSTSSQTFIGVDEVSTVSTSSPTGRGHAGPATPPMRLSNSARGAIRRQVPEGVATAPGSAVREIIDRQLEPRTTAAYQAAAAAMGVGAGAGDHASVGTAAVTNRGAQLAVGKRVSVFQKVGQCWSMARIASLETGGTVTVVYEPSQAMETGVAPSRIAPLPEVPRAEDKRVPGVISYRNGLPAGVVTGRPAYQPQRGYPAPVQMHTGRGAHLTPASYAAMPSYASQPYAVLV